MLEFKFELGVAAKAWFAAEPTPKMMISAPTSASPFTHLLFFMTIPCSLLQPKLR